jgi:hypothetical protein
VGYGTCPVVVGECGGEGASDSLQRRDARVTTWTAVNLCDFYTRNLSTLILLFVESGYNIVTVM